MFKLLLIILVFITLGCETNRSAKNASQWKTLALSEAIDCDFIRFSKRPSYYTKSLTFQPFTAANNRGVFRGTALTKAGQKVSMSAPATKGFLVDDSVEPHFFPVKEFETVLGYANNGTELLTLNQEEMDVSYLNQYELLSPKESLSVKTGNSDSLKNKNKPKIPSASFKAVAISGISEASDFKLLDSALGMDASISFYGYDDFLKVFILDKTSERPIKPAGIFSSNLKVIEGESAKGTSHVSAVAALYEVKENKVSVYPVKTAYPQSSAGADQKANKGSKSAPVDQNASPRLTLGDAVDIVAEEAVESLSFSWAPNHSLLLSAILGDSSVGASRLVIYEVDLKAKTSKLLGRKVLGEGYQGEPYVYVKNGAVFILNLTWLDSDRTLSVYKVLKKGIQDPKILGIFPASSQLNQVVSVGNKAFVTIGYLQKPPEESSAFSRSYEFKRCRLDI